MKLSLRLILSIFLSFSTLIVLSNDSFAKRIKKNKTQATTKSQKKKTSRAPASIKKVKLSKAERIKDYKLRSYAKERPLSKKNWFKKMRKTLSRDMCNKGSYLRTCFSLKAKTCVREFSQSMTTCWGRQSAAVRSNKIFPRGDGIKIGANLGQCAGVAIEKRLRAKKQKTKICNNMTYWMGR